jgi:UDP-glucose 4-epimerase
MKSLVLGGSGFIGGHLSEKLNKRGHEVMIADVKRPDGFEWSEGFINLNILDYDSLDRLVSEFKPDVIFECSGILGTAETFAHISQTVDVNIRGVLNALEVTKKYDTSLIYIGLTNRWLNPYTITKQTASLFCQMYNKEFNTKVVCIKGLNAYGSRQHWKKVRKIGPTLITRAIQNLPIQINGSGNQVIDLIHTDDLTEIMYLAWEKGVWGEVFDGGTGIPITVNEVAQTIVKLAQSESIIEHIPMRRGEPEVSVTLANPAPVKQLLGFYPKVSLEDGLISTIKWYRENYEKFDL